MKRTMIVGACASLLALAACEQSAKEQEIKAEQAQRQADDKAARAQKEANEKAVKAQNEADEKAAQATAEARHDMAKGQAKANEEIRTANQDMVKQRTDFQVKAQKEVNEIDNKIDDLKVKAQKAEPKAKTDFNEAMKVVDSKRTALDTDLKTLDTQAPPQTFDSYRAMVDKEIGELKKSVDVAKQKL